MSAIGLAIGALFSAVLIVAVGVLILLMWGDDRRREIQVYKARRKTALRRSDDEPRHGPGDNEPDRAQL